MKRLKLSLYSLLLVAVLNVTAQAQDRQPKKGEMNQEHMMQMMHRMMENPDHRVMMLPCLASELADDLNLSTVQKERLSAIRNEAMNKFGMRGMKRGGMRQMDMNREGVRRMDKQTMQEMVTKRSADVSEILTAEQLQRLNDLDMPVFHAAMMARMESQEGGMMNCPMMEQMMDDQMMNGPGSESDDHQH